MIPHDILVLEANKREEYERKEGMSVPTIKWYFDGLWAEYANRIGKGEEWRTSGPKTEDNTNGNNFFLSLPILKHKGE
jgi:hypothetical protein